jgi:hypothetical protein
MRAVKQRIHWGRERFELREMPFDRFNFRTQAMELPSRAAPAFFAPLGAFLGALALLGAKCARFGPTLAFCEGFAFSVAGVFSVVVIM